MDTLQSFLMGDEPWPFLFEVMLRSLIGFVTVVIGIKITGKRGVRQLSLFELVIILTLGSASGDIAFYNDVGILPAVLTILTIVSLYRIVTFLLIKSRAIGKFIEGEAIILIEDGRFTSSTIKEENISYDEFYMELRQSGIEHIGQVRYAILEVDGDLSVYKNEGSEIKPGLHILPHIIKDLYEEIPEGGLYACVYCGETSKQKKGAKPKCSCGRSKWGKASTRDCQEENINTKNSK